LKSLNHERNKYKSILLTIALALVARNAPGWPDTMLGRGDEAVLAAPRADFGIELESLRLPRARFQARNTVDFAAEAAEADAADLRAALKEKNLPKARQNSVLRNFEAERARLTDFRARLQSWNPDGEWGYVDGEYVHHDPQPRPAMEDFNVAALADVPGEFVDYLQGSAAWANGQTNQARAFWEALVRRPAAERQYRSVWAAYMLGKSWLPDDPEKAVGYFQQVRVLKLRGFTDRIGLAAASLGQEARAYLRQQKFEEAIGLYIEQLAAKDNTAGSSLRFACRDALASGMDLTALAANPETRRVMTAFIISESYTFQDTIETNRVRWLEAAETADVKDAASVEALALAAYQAGRWETAQRWIHLAPQTPTIQWLRAKLLMRDGKTAQASALLQRIVKLFPAPQSDTNELRNGGLENALYMNRSDYAGEAGCVRRQIQAEIGMLHLARRQYKESLDSLLRAGRWSDAAYVGERVLTLPELKNYVDQNCPPGTNSVNNTADGDDLFASNCEYIRHLLARRLARAGEFDDARAYYPSNLVDDYDAMVKNLDAARNADLSGAQRAEAYVAAAHIFHTNGMELLGTEVWPDWRVTGGDEYRVFEPTENRQATNSVVTTASDDELERAREGVDPSLRFHYRYQAAGLAWEAAKLMADNTDEKARILCTAGSWIKDRDPEAADYFYKAIVRHCRKTAIGSLADRMRWFPILDQDGNPVPWKPAAPLEMEQEPGAETAGFWYALSRGNSLQDVIEAAQQGHNLETSVAMLEQANPGISLNRLKVGQKIFVPASAPPEVPPTPETPEMQETSEPPEPPPQ
jgi:hypothetical protein